MIKITEKALLDLEFNTVCQQVEKFCTTELGKILALQQKPFAKRQEVIRALEQTNEYLSSELQEKPIPNHYFDKIEKEIHLLSIENSTLDVLGFRKIAAISETTNALILFFRKYKEIYPYLYQFSNEVESLTEISEHVGVVINKFGEIKNDASSLLFQLRKELDEVKEQINKSFEVDLNRYQKLEYLDEIKETVVDHIRVLAVNAMYRKKVKGAVLGTSKTGSIVYMQPENTVHFTRRLTQLQYEEKKEVQRILNELTQRIKPYRPLLIIYQNFLSQMDVIAAKKNYAKQIDAVLPKITSNREIELKQAYHPLLFLSNKKTHKKTFPQDIILNKDNRIIVISGPNAGGKSITLKTVGLLQVMLQSGMLIPVHAHSRVCLFNKVLTDIGDNQSIENQLSTYSYRLKNMKYFLRHCDENTLFLIDEFGTGSDPELGGALAETFLEVFYEKQSFGIITTHYANLKKMAQETEGIINANMLFNSHTFEPIYKLQLGEAGSSFTFEVAQKIGIPYSLINRSKKKVERGKINFDKNIAKLQRERSKLEKTTKSLKKKEQSAEKEQEKLTQINTKIQEKLEGFQELYDANQKYIHIGKKIDQLALEFFQKKNKKKLMIELQKIVAVENSKREASRALASKKAKAEKAKKEKIQQEAIQQIEVIREKKKEEKAQQKVKEQEIRKEKIANFKVGDTVRIEGSRSNGTIDKIEKKKAIVNYGMFTTEIALDQLELIKKAK
ncbi:DNA mismatch repair protein MutS [Mesonia sp. K7]|uniref:endonuclease MutS2 n=1 Tax=Mesonia sp. K7 TaxID=2218606 RepID=UPI000DA96407|nr:DNA mismatch repair protein MutS [Mesonia sp. K7]PZD79190.1 DNA mismatch repair protein MutS [Mesonia sp. K7]